MVNSPTATYYAHPDQAAIPQRRRCPNPTCLSFETCLMKLNSQNYEDVVVVIAAAETAVFCRSEKGVLEVLVLMKTR